MQIEVKIEDARLMSSLRRFMAQAAHPEQVMRRIADSMEHATRLRFETKTGPDGRRWKPSRGNPDTLVKDGRLVDTVSSRSGSDFAEWGVNRIYAAIHQFGGDIKPKNKKSLRFKVAGGFMFAKQVTIPARPFLGISADDRQEILHILRQHYGAGIAR